MKDLKIPGFIYSALIIASIEFLRVITEGFQEYSDEWWIPLVIMLATAGIKALEVIKDEVPGFEDSLQDNVPGTRSYRIKRTSKTRRFLLG